MEDFIKGLSEEILNGKKLTKQEALNILSTPDELLMDLVVRVLKIVLFVLNLQNILLL